MLGLVVAMEAPRRVTQHMTTDDYAWKPTRMGLSHVFFLGHTDKANDRFSFAVD